MTGMHRTTIISALVAGLALTSLTACSSTSSSTAASTVVSTTVSDSTTSTSPASTTEAPATTTATTSAPPATPAPTSPPPSGPTVVSVSVPKTSYTCAEAQAQGEQVQVSWKVANAASVTLSIDGPGAFKTGLPTTGSEMVYLGCGDTQQIWITPVAANGTQGAPKIVTVTVGS